MSSCFLRLSSPSLIVCHRQREQHTSKSEVETMPPITIACEQTLSLPPEQIAEGILDLARWPEFEGYGPLPGIESAEFETRTPQVTGTRIRVKNRDGSTHVEEITEWDPQRRIKLVMTGFAPPLSRLAKSFEETWLFTPTEQGTQVTRRFELHPTSALTRPLLWLIARLMKRAVERHLRQMQGAETVPAGARKNPT